MELGIDEYIIWNASNNYDPMTFFYSGRINPNTRQSGKDLLARTPEETLKRYLDAEKNQRNSVVYLLTPLTGRSADYDEFVTETEKNPTVLKSYEILSIKQNEDIQHGCGYVTYGSEAGIERRRSRFKIVSENDVYKVVKPDNK